MDTTPDYSPGTYVKGDSVRIARTAAQAVALVFDGYKSTAEQAESVEDADYRDLQAQAKTLGVSANQGKASIAKAIAKATQPPAADADETDN